MEAYFDYDKVTGLSNALGGRVDLLEKVLGLKVRENLKYSDIQKIAASGLANEFFDIGDEIMTTYTATDGTVYDFPWRVVDFRDVYWENDPNPHPGMVLMSKYATLEQVTFDAKEYAIIDSETETTAQEGAYYFGIRITGNIWNKLNLNTGDSIPFSDYDNICKSAFEDKLILHNGFANYKQSAIRQWLNSDADAGEWWTPGHFLDVAPAESSTLNGFMAGLPSEFIEVLTPSKIYQVFNGVSEVMYDKMFLPSVEEMYGTHDTSIVDIEGPYFQYWKKQTDFDFPNNLKSNGRKVLPTGQFASACRLRSNNYNVNNINSYILLCSDGSIISGPVYYAFNVLPCCVIS